MLREVRATLGKYKHVEQEVVQRMHRLEVKEPEIQKCLDAVNMLIEKRDGDGDEVRCFHAFYRSEWKYCGGDGLSRCELGTKYFETVFLSMCAPLVAADNPGLFAIRSLICACKD